MVKSISLIRSSPPFRFSFIQSFLSVKSISLIQSSPSFRFSLIQSLCSIKSTCLIQPSLFLRFTFSFTLFFCFLLLRFWDLFRLSTLLHLVWDIKISFSHVCSLEISTGTASNILVCNSKAKSQRYWTKILIAEPFIRTAVPFGSGLPKQLRA